MTTTDLTTSSGPITGGPRRQPAVHALRVSEVERLTDEAVTISFEVPDRLREDYDFVPGQYLTLCRRFDGKEVRRSYSICAPAGQGRLRVAVKRLEGGLFSRWAVDELEAGEVLDVLTPTGRFGISFAPGRRRHYAAVAAGSGITPVLSLVATALIVEPECRFTLVYGNRSTATTMFLDELADLQVLHPGRLQVFHVLSREPQDRPVLSGRIDGDKLRLLESEVLEPADVDEWFLCGPVDMVEEARAALRAADVPSGAVHHELFHVPAEDPAQRQEAPASTAEAQASAVTVVLTGRSTVLQLRGDGESVLEAVLRERPDAPYACQEGVCGMCRAKCTAGSVRMDEDYALEEEEKADGYVLTCQSHPTSDEVTVDFDQ